MNTNLRLRVTWLLFGMMFFFGVEQLFLNAFIKDPHARGYLTVAYVSALVLFDIPTGIFADKVSRKLCMLLAAVVQIIALLILGSSNTLPMYLLGSLIFGIFICLINGASQAILYDWLALTKRTKDYSKEQGRNYAAFLIGAGIANIASGFIANSFGLPSTYYLSVIPAALAFILLLRLDDPPIAKKQDGLWYNHLGEVIREILNHRKIIIYSLQFIACAVTLYTVGEFGQVYMLAFKISTVTLGIFWAIDALFAATGQALAHKFQARSRLLVLASCVTAVLFILVERKIGIGLFWLFYGLNEAVANIAETEIQHQTSSHLRATTFSLISFVGNLLAIPIILAYNHYYLTHTIFAANRLIVLFIVPILLATLLVKPSTKSDDDSTSINRLKTTV